jgi:uncharacterized repeat protein (TIGR04138 family)
MPEPTHSILDLIRQDKRYRLEAYLFMFEALHYAQSVLALGKYAESEPAAVPEAELEQEEQGPQRHVSGQELCEAIRRYALEQYGFMALTVLNSWGVRCTGDFGEIVFNLIRIGRMRKTKHDRREDFNNVFDFATAFQEFKITME